MAGICLPFHPIVRELLTYFQLSPFQVIPNGWRFFLRSYILWPSINPRCLMSIPEFLALYRSLFKESGTMSFISRRTTPGLIWIDSKGHQSNNKGWDYEFFYVSREWECSSGQVLSEEEKVPREWGTLKKEWDDFPTLTRE